MGKRTAAAAFRVATQLVDERLITMDEALTRVTSDQLNQLMFPQFERTDGLPPRPPRRSRHLQPHRADGEPD